MHSQKEKLWFTEQVRPMLDTLYRVAYALMQNDADAQDAVQDCIEKAYTSFGSLRERSKFQPWMIRILKNECYRILRERKRLIPFDDLPETGETPQDTLDLKAAFSRLSPQSRLAVTLYYYEGYHVPEIAALLNEPEGTIKSRLSRARQALRKELTDQEVSYAN
mgnify:CR=1 FL=1